MERSAAELHEIREEGPPMLKLGLFHDVRYACRLMRREPGYTAVAVTAIALGIAATSTLFSVAYGVVWKPLPWSEPERLVRLEERRGGQAGRIPWTISSATYLAWRGQSSMVEEIGGWMAVPATLRGVGDPERIRIARMTPGMFSLLRARAAVGRLFVEDDAARSQTEVVILSSGFWQRRFGGSPDAIGRSVSLDDRLHTVVGVMPREFAFPDRETEAWIPAHVPPALQDGGKRISVMIFGAMARVRPGVTPQQVGAEGTSQAQGAPDIAKAGLALFGSSGPVTITAAPALDVVTSEVRPAIQVLFVAVLLLFATAVASVTTVQLARAAKRRREMTIRAALGAGTGLLARQWLIESALVGLAGGIMGLLGATMLLRLLPVVLPADFPRLGDVVLDWRVAAFATVATFVSSTVCGLLPGLQTRHIDLVQTLSDDNTAPVGGTMRTAAARTRVVIMGGQVAIACVLLVGAGLLARSLFALIHVDRGYDSNNLLTARLPLAPRTTYAQAAAMLERTRDRLLALPGVAHVAFGNALPLVSTGGLSGFTLPSPRDSSTRVEVQAFHRTVSPEFFETMRLRLLAGRFLADTDTAASQSVIVVNRSFAAKYLGKEPVGQRLQYSMYGRGGWEVVGVVDDMKQGGLDAAGFRETADAAQPEMFTSYRQLGDMFPVTVFLIARTNGDPLPLAPALRGLVREEAPSLVLDSVLTMEDRLMSSLAKPRTYAVVLGGFAFFAIAIAGVGLFGVLSYSVAQRTREIGVRTALGARTADVVALVVKQGTIITGTGLIVGLAAAAGLVQALSTILYGVRPYDTLTFIVVPVAILAVAALACAVPVWRATRIDPLSALRSN
jgi:putative ABC transport system permease protein